MFNILVTIILYSLALTVVYFIEEYYNIDLSYLRLFLNGPVTWIALAVLLPVYSLVRRNRRKQTRRRRSRRAAEENQKWDDLKERVDK